MNVRVFIRKYVWYIALFAIAIYLYAFHLSTGTVKPSIKEFAFTDTSRITSITISNDSSLIKLNRTSKGWLLNENFKANNEAVLTLLNVLSHISVGVPIPKVVSDSLISVLESNGIEVKIYDGERILKNYSIHRTQTLNLGSIGKLKSSRMAFTLKILGFKGDIASLFVLEPDFWKSNLLFVADISQIAHIDVEIPNSPEKSFAISFDENEIHLKATFFDKNIDQFDTSNVVDFIIGLTDLSFEKLIPKSSIEDKAAIILSQPEQIFTITLTNNKQLVLKTYPIPIDEYRDEFGRTVKFDLNRLYISFNNDAILAVAKYIVFDPVLKDLSSFRIKN